MPPQSSMNSMRPSLSANKAFAAASQLECTNDNIDGVKVTRSPNRPENTPKLGDNITADASARDIQLIFTHTQISELMFH